MELGLHLDRRGFSYSEMEEARSSGGWLTALLLGLRFFVGWDGMHRTPAMGLDMSL